jgi:hypothetical protein
MIKKILKTILSVLWAIGAIFLIFAALLSQSIVVNATLLLLILFSGLIYGLKVIMDYETRYSNESLPVGARDTKRHNFLCSFAWFFPIYVLIICPSIAALFPDWHYMDLLVKTDTISIVPAFAALCWLGLRSI